MDIFFNRNKKYSLWYMKITLSAWSNCTCQTYFSQHIQESALYQKRILWSCPRVQSTPHGVLYRCEIKLSDVFANKPFVEEMDRQGSGPRGMTSDWYPRVCLGAVVTLDLQHYQLTCGHVFKILWLGRSKARPISLSALKNGHAARTVAAMRASVFITDTHTVAMDTW